MGKNSYTEYEVVARPRIVTFGTNRPWDLLSEFLGNPKRVVGHRFTMTDVMAWASYFQKPLTMPQARRCLYLAKDQIRSRKIKKRDKDQVPALEETQEFYPYEYFGDRDKREELLSSRREPMFVPNYEATIDWIVAIAALLVLTGLTIWNILPV